MRYSQKELLDEGFWDKFTKNPAMGVLRAAGKGIAKTLDYVAPELTRPIHGIESAVRDIAGETKKGWDIGMYGNERAVADMLLDLGYLYDKNSLTKTGKNLVCTAHKIDSHDTQGNPIANNRKSRILMDKNLNVIDIDGRRPRDKAMVGPSSPSPRRTSSPSPRRTTP